MRALIKFTAVLIFVFLFAGMFFFSQRGTVAPSVSAQAKPTPPPAAASDKTIQKSFVLSKDSVSEYGESPFDHESHAFKNYSPDGKSPIACIECHHTDQP